MDILPNAYRSLIYVHLLLIKDDQVLLMHRANTGMYDGYWALPAGRLEKLEMVSEAMIREAQEEINVIIKPEFSSVIAVRRPYVNDPSQIWQEIGFFFTAREWENEIQNLEPHKHDKLQFWPLNQLPENVMALQLEGIYNYFNKRSYSEFAS